MKIMNKYVPNEGKYNSNIKMTQNARRKVSPSQKADEMYFLL
jgi:hypothetical protein